MPISTVATCDCCDASLPSAGIPDVLTVIRIDEDTRSVVQEFYGYPCGCAQRIAHAIGLEINKHDSLHKPPVSE